MSEYRIKIDLGRCYIQKKEPDCEWRNIGGYYDIHEEAVEELERLRDSQSENPTFFYDDHGNLISGD